MTSHFHQHACTASCTEFCSIYDPATTARIVAEDAVEDTMYVQRCNSRRAAKRILWDGFDDWLWPEWWSEQELKAVLSHLTQHLKDIAA